MGDFYTKSGAPTTRANLTSSVMRSEFALIEAAFDKLPALTGNGSKFLRINSGGTAVEALSAADVRAALGLETVFEMKTADESVTASTTLQNDNELVLAVLANSTYIIEMGIRVVQGAAASIGLKFAWTVPSGASIKFGGNSYASSTVSTVNGTEAGDNASLTLSTDLCLVNLRGILVTGGAAGNVQFQFAQNSSNASAITVKSGSYMSLTKIG